MLPGQGAFVRNSLAEMGEGTVEQVSSCFVKAPRKQVEAILQSLAAFSAPIGTGTLCRFTASGSDPLLCPRCVPDDLGDV
jgi:hypothetical protein